MASQLDLHSLMPLSVAGCRRLQLGAGNWAASVALQQVIICLISLSIQQVVDN